MTLSWAKRQVTDPTPSCGAVHAATLVQAHGLAAGVASARPAARITRIAGKLSRYQHVPQVAAALEQIAI